MRLAPRAAAVCRGRDARQTLGLEVGSLCGSKNDGSSAHHDDLPSTNWHACTRWGWSFTGSSLLPFPPSPSPCHWIDRLRPGASVAERLSVKVICVGIIRDEWHALPRRESSQAGHGGPVSDVRVPRRR